VDFTPAVADASRAVAGAVGNIEASAPSGLEIGQSIGTQLGASRARNLAALRELAGVTAGIGQTRGALTGAAADISTSLQSLSTQERIAGAKRVTKQSKSPIDTLASALGLGTLLFAPEFGLGIKGFNLFKGLFKGGGDDFDLGGVDFDTSGDIPTDPFDFLDTSVNV
jgi:hypothetical protein